MYIYMYIYIYIYIYILDHAVLFHWSCQNCNLGDDEEDAIFAGMPCSICGQTMEECNDLDEDFYYTPPSGIVKVGLQKQGFFEK